MTWYDYDKMVMPEVDGMYLKETVDYEKAYQHLYGRVAFMLRSVEDEMVKCDLLRQWDHLRRGMPL